MIDFKYFIEVAKLLDIGDEVFLYDVKTNPKKCLCSFIKVKFYCWNDAYFMSWDSNIVYDADVLYNMMDNVEGFSCLTSNGVMEKILKYII